MQQEFIEEKQSPKFIEPILDLNVVIDLPWGGEWQMKMNVEKSDGLKDSGEGKIKRSKI
jgi:hypothetical protein